MPTVLLTTERFEDLSREVARTYALPQMRLAAIEHPLGAIPDEAIDARADAVIESVLAQLRSGD